MDSPQPLYDDSALLRLICAGEEHGLELLFKRYYTMMCNAAFRFLQEKAGAEDVVQDVFFRVWERRAQLDPETDIKPYLLRSVRNASLNVLRVSKRHQGFEAEVLDARLQVVRAGDDELAYKEMQERVQQAIDKLPEKCREVFVLSRMEQKSQKEIAEQLGISVKTVENQMTKALKRLREELGPYLNELPVALLSLLFLR